MKQRSTAFGLLALLFTLAAPGLALAQGKTAVIDSAAVLDRCAEGQRALAAHRKQLEPDLAELKRMEQQIKKEMEALEKAQANEKIKEVELSERRRKLISAQQRLSERAAELQRSSQEGEKKALEPVRQRLSATLRRIAAEEGYEVVVERSTAPYARPDLDLTERVITMMDGTK